MILGPDGRPLRRPVTSEIVTMETDWMRYFRILPNPDLILQKTGRGIEIYQDMKTDAHIASCMRSRKSGVLSKEWDVHPVSTKPIDVEIANFVKNNLNNLDWDQDLKQMLDAPFVGFRVMEIMWTEEDGKWKIQSLKARPQRRFTFNTSYELRVLNYTTLNDEAIPPAKFILVQHDAEEENPYGERLFSPCFWPWYFKKHGYKFWAIYTEKYGMPTAVGKYQPGASQEDKQSLLDALDSLVQDAAVAIPSNSELDFKETSGDKAEVHRLFLTFCNSEISKAILGQTLTTEMGDTGSFSAAKVHQDVRNDIVESDAKMLMGAINSQLIPPLVEFNFGPQKSYPAFKIQYAPEDSVKKDLTDRDKNLVEMGLPMGVKYFYTRYNIPEPDKGEKIVQPSAAPQLSQQFSQAEQKTYQIDFAEGDDQKVIARDQILQGYYTRALDQGLTYYGRMVRELKQEIQGWQSLDKAGALKVSNEAITSLGDYFTKVALTGYMLGEYDAWKDYDEAVKQETSSDFADPIYTIKPIPLDLEDAISYFSRLMPVDINDYRQLQTDLKAKYFTIAEAEGQAMVEQLKGYVQQAIEKGTTLEEFKKNANDLFGQMGLEPADPWKLETAFRTNVQTAYGAGNYEKYQDPDLKDMLPYFRYSAILDSGTRPTHRAMNGFIAARDDPIWDEWWPPNGFNCRCGVVAINKYKAEREGIKPQSTSNLPLPDTGFARNPGKALREVPASIKQGE